MKTNLIMRMALVLLISSISVSSFAQFSGDYDPANWTFYSNTNLGGGDGYINTAGAPASIELGGSDAGAYCCDGQEEYTITICNSGNISFDYSHVNPDLDDAYYVLNGVETQITYATATGSVGPIAVNAGDVFGFIVKNYDDCCGRGVLTISNFSGPACCYNDFTGPLDPANWTFYSNTNLGGGDGYVDWTSAPASVELGGSDANAYCCDGQEELTITIPIDGSVTFDYSHVNPDLDDAYYVLNGVETQIIYGTGTGSVGPIAVNAGDVFGFIVKNYDDCCGRGVLTISNIAIGNCSACDPSIITPDAMSLSDLTDACSVSAPTAPTATDDCGAVLTGTPDVTFPITTSGTTIVTWTFDNGTASTTQTQNVIISDVTAPVADLMTLSDVNDVCSATPAAPTATDNCSGTVTGTPDVTFPITAQGTTVVTWTYTDGSGNTSTQMQNVILTDVDAPTASNLDSVFVECIGDVPAPNVADVTDAADNCTPIVTHVSDVSDGLTCPETITRTYNVADEAGNNIDVTQIITVEDITAPTASNPLPLSVQCVGDIPAPNVGWVTDEADNCTAAPTVTWVSDVSDGMSCPETITRTFSVTDDCGNETLVDQLVIVNDVDAPVADAASLATETAFCDVTLTAPTATDNCDGTVTGVADVTFPINTVGTTTVTWTFTDACGNASTQTQDVVIEQIDATTFMASDNITMVATNVNTGVTYQWIDCATNQPVAGATDRNFTPTYGSDFAVIVTEDGCSDTSACVNSTVGIHELATIYLNLHPNPTENGEFSVEVEGGIKSMEVLDMAGRTIALPMNVEAGTVNGSTLASGKYIVRVTTNEDKTVLGTIVVQK
jgi:hypothetical protein